MIGDAYEVMDRLIQRRKHYDIVVVDPPAFAQRKSNVDRALHAYGQLTQRAVQLVRTDGLLVQASCSSRITEEQFFANVRGSAQRAGYDLVEVRRTGHAIDHPVTFAQGGYLKALVRPSDTARVGLLSEVMRGVPGMIRLTCESDGTSRARSGSHVSRTARTGCLSGDPAHM